MLGIKFLKTMNQLIGQVFYRGHWGGIAQNMQNPSDGLCVTFCFGDQAAIGERPFANGTDISETSG